MGSITDLDLPDANSPQLELRHPTDAEKRRTWELNYNEWGGALSLEAYLEREPYLMEIPLSIDGGMKHWILTDTSAPEHSRPVLANVETLRKRVLVAEKGKVREEIAYGICSVYTDPKFRQRRYASRMLRELELKLKPGLERDQRPIASALWSDIGKSFYANLGWLPFESLHASFPVCCEANVTTIPATGAKPIKDGNLESFCKLDEELLREKMARDTEGNKAKFAFAPDYDIMRWHLHRDEWITIKLRREKPEIKGAVAGPDGKRVWAIWTRNYSGDTTKPEKNKLYIIRLVVEDESAPLDELARSFTAVMRAAQREAVIWKAGKMDLWNPSSTVRGLIEKSALPCEWVDRQDDHIPSLMWYGEGRGVEGVEWVANEKFCWC